MILQCFYLIIPAIFVVCTNCVQYEYDDRSAKIFLSEHEDAIEAAILHLCPKNLTSVFIYAADNVSRSLNLSIFSSNDFPELVSANVSVHNLYLIQPRDTNFTTNLQHLSLSNCGIRVLPALHVLLGFSELISLDVSWNSLKRLPPDLFSYSKKLNFVNASRNYLSLLPNDLVSRTNPIELDITGNPVGCTCVNSWFSKSFHLIGLNNCIFPHPCTPSVSFDLLVDPPTFSANDSLNVSVMASHSISMNCVINSTIPVETFWFTPLGVFPATTHEYIFYVQPILAPTVIKMFNFSSSSFKLEIVNIRGYLRGRWFCIGVSGSQHITSRVVDLNVYSSIYKSHVYVVTLCYGYATMVMLLFIGIIGGTIRYCSETHCMRRPQLPFNYGGKTFIGVIPVPEVEDVKYYTKAKRSETIVNNDTLETKKLSKLCHICSKPPTYWFCDVCKTAHFVESMYKLNPSHLFSASNTLCIGTLTMDGQIQISQDQELHPLAQLCSSEETLQDAHQPLVDVPENNDISYVEQENSASVETEKAIPTICVRSGTCIVRICGISDKFDKDSLNVSPCDTSSITDYICTHYRQRPNSADVKLVVSNERLAEEYREALEDLARAVGSSDPAYFRDHLDDFRNRLMKDVGHRVQILRGEFEGLRARSAKSVASLRSQSSAAAQRMRAGFSHGVEQVKDGMRSVAELCGNVSTIGQTISVVSVYVDETDQVKKERFISDFVF